MTNAPSSPTQTADSRSLADLAFGLGLAGLLPVPGIVASVAAIVCGWRAMREADGADRARLGVYLGIIGVAAPLLFLTVYCGVLGYPFPLHRYHPH